MNLSEDLWFHQQNMQIYGLHLPGMRDVSDGYDQDFNFVRLKFSNENESARIDSAPFKLPVMTREKTPYSYADEELLFEEEKLSFEGVTVRRIPLPPIGDNWHLKGYTLPFDGTKNPYHELRLNLRISGYCPGRCVFCHRWHSHAKKPTVKRFYSPGEVLDRVTENEGSDVFSTIHQIMYLSELFGREDRFLESIEHTHNELMARNYLPNGIFYCSAQDVRSRDGLKRLLRLVRPAVYAFTLEFFHEREKLMGKYKGLPIEEVYQILENAREVGFEEIQLNYLAGIDSVDQCAKGFEELASRGLVDTIGLSTFTLFNAHQAVYRHDTAWDVSYYRNVAEMLNSLKIMAHNFEAYDMRCPFGELMEKRWL